MKILPGRTPSSGNIFDGFSMFPNGFHEFINAFPMVFSPFKEWNSSESQRPKQRIPGKFCQKPSTRSSCASCSSTSVLYSSLWQSLPGRRSQNKAVRSFKSSLAGILAAASIINFVVIVAACSIFEQRHLFNGAPPVSTGTRISQPEDEVSDESFRSRHSRQQRFVFCFSHAVCANSQLF